MSILHFRRNPQITEEKILSAQEDVDRWVAIKKLMASDGWHYLSGDLKREIERLDTIKGVTPETLADRAARLEGMEWPFTRIREYERAAIESEKLLALVAKQAKES